MKLKLDEWEQALADAMGERADTVPKGWITMAEYGKRIGKSDSATRRDMRVLTESGWAEAKKFNVLRDGRVIPVPHYRLKK